MLPMVHHLFRLPDRFSAQHEAVQFVALYKAVARQHV